MDRFNDHRTIKKDLQYIDGSIGGIENLFLNSLAIYRYSMGYDYGKNHVEEIINSLAHTGGVIHETLKIVTHSMGGVFGKGFVQAIVDWAYDNPEKARGLNIAEYDFAPFQQNVIQAVEGVTTYQYDNYGDFIVGYKLIGGSYFQLQKGAEQESEMGWGSHSIFDFSSRILNLPPGRYVFQSGKFVKVN